jgi:tRNA A-37 threonylcarbamoyl transferase component Bud32
MRPAQAEQTRPLSEHRAGAVTVYLNPHYGREVKLDDLLRMPALLKDVPGRSSRQAGRTTVWHWRPAWNAEPGLIVRQYAHGGLLGPLGGVAFLGRRRMLEELCVAIHAWRRQVPTSIPVAVRTERLAGPLCTGFFVSEAIPGAVNLLEFLETAAAAGRPDPEARKRLADALASAIASMHDAGIVHGDLNLKNLLVRVSVDRPEAFVVDFDRARLVPGVSLRQRMANLTRLDRSVTKWAVSRKLVSAADRLRVARSYLERYPQWRDSWQQIAVRYAGKRLLHRFSRQSD